MTECKHKKRVQLFLDGWMAGSASSEIEEHIRSCPECQAEMAELIEVNSAAQEIIDQAPDRGYWDSFTSRVRKRIIAREFEPEINDHREPGYPIVKLASVLAIIVLFIGATFMFVHHSVQNPQNGTPMPTTMAERPLPGMFPFPPPRITDMLAGRQKLPVESSHPRPVRVTDKILGKPKNPAKGGMASLGLEDPSLQFKSILPNKADEYFVSNEVALTAPTSLGENSNSSNPAFRLKNGFVGQRILAGLGIEAQNSSGFGDRNPLYGSNQSSPGDDGGSSNWGYARNPADTSNASEIRKYIIELELMQAK